MTIKEVEKRLDIPRATVRYYEKEGLIDPIREENGYRDYSEEDVEKLRKIIILRKIGMSVEDINDVFDGVKSMNEALEANIIHLQKQMEELQGAIKLSRKMKEDAVELSSMDTNIYWNTIAIEEKQGNSFMDIAKDIVEVEKGVIKSYFSFSDIGGKNYDTFPALIRNIFICAALSGCISCLMRGAWSFKNFMGGIIGLGCIMLVEMAISVPLYFLGKKYEWIRKNRTKALVIAALILVVILLILDNALGI